MLHKFCLLSSFEIKSNISSNCLPTHRRGAHRNFSIIPSYFNVEILVRWLLLGTLCSKWLNPSNLLHKNISQDMHFECTFSLFPSVSIEIFKHPHLCPQPPKYPFACLTEISDYLLVTNSTGLKGLKELFPVLTVIR